MSRLALYAKLEPLIRPEQPFANLPERSAGRWGEGLTTAGMKECVWVHPELVVERSFLEWTASDHLRHTAFKRVRADKDARSVTWET